jgi:hypothetical protein
MSLTIQTLDRKIWRKDKVIAYLYQCLTLNTLALLDFMPEGSCCEALGLYRLLDDFCQSTGYPKSNITIMTANMLEHHSEYHIKKQSEYWYEIGEHKNWLQSNNINVTTNITKHFANFTSRSNWARLWLATIINKKFSHTTLQTYHYDPQRENYNLNGYLGLDDLFRFGCDIVPDAATFLIDCPKTIDIDFLKTCDTSNSFFQHAQSYYPIQYPANLNLLQYYSDIFVDVFTEANVSGNCFLATEKTWRPIIAQRPFIVLSNVGFLENLKKLGFKTFNKYWDEQYDSYSDGGRITQIETVLDTISSWPIEHCKEILEDMQPILKHNFECYNQLTTDQISKIFDGIN